MNDKLGVHYDRIFRWIRDEKHLHSQQLGYDVGVPATVDYLIARAYSLRERGSVPENSNSKSMDSYLFNDARREHGIADRETWITTYFFGALFAEDSKDDDGENPFEGELRRFESQRHGTSVDEVVINAQIVQDYAKVHDLGEVFQRYALSKLDLTENC
ncbi:MAG: hypothetical protein PHF67_00050 [Candidatus Nanoarchaeia archaeon]|nr:hypothetical protein [Candidatus Nanoarchaeia archaeon]